MAEERKDKRRSQRFPCSIPVHIWVGKTRVEATSRDASRHGMYLRTTAPPKERFLVKLDIQTPEARLEATAFVTRRVTTGPDAGVGVQFFALSSEAKAQWDAFVARLAGAGVQWAAPAKSMLPADSANFLIKLRNPERMVEFFERNIRSGKVFMTTPVLRDVGAPVALIIIHPESEREFLVTGSVETVSQAPKGMALAIDALTPKLERRFYEFVETGHPSESMDLLLHPEKELASAPPPSPPSPPSSPEDASREPANASNPFSELSQSMPMAFDLDDETGELSLDIEIDEASLDDLQHFEPVVYASSDNLPVQGVTIRCTGCGTFLGPVDVEALPEAVEWVAERQCHFDRFSGVFEHRIEPKPVEELDRLRIEHSKESVPAEALFQVARYWAQHEPEPPRGPNFEPHLRDAATKLSTQSQRVKLEVACPICSEKQLFASVD